ncbi:SxtJ family membrane protein [Mucilaginibacter sp. SP1R1]|uniref:SxtJ family membrane protein n=1 Tax=Mucilaginibacter sp. SP1R1 TaxID=2723091 RepID=UPI00161AE421|nr:SxtJ family membrane protein [Mucilaginibacter sp. SP1R1]MBB6147684.1 putative nucleic acid-binding Zn ribbon protein [Mucilaginibacter sp. SP1R1]
MADIQVNKKFGLVTGGACLFIVAYQQLVHHRFWILLFVPGVLLLLVAVLAPKLLNRLRLAWEKTGHILGTINTTVILFLVFFLIITPLGFVMRLMNKTLLITGFKPGLTTYWQPVNKNSRESMKQQF